MAFEGLTGAPATPGRRARRVMYVVSALVHVCAVVAAVAYSFWHVEELSPPRVTVTFMSMAPPPPPPPPPPPLGGGPGPAPRRHTRAPVNVIPLPTVKVPEVVQPRPPESRPLPVEPVPGRTLPDTTSAPAGAGVPDGVKGGAVGGLKGGVVGGSLGGTGTAPAAPSSKFLPPQMGAQQKLSGADPQFPPALRTAGARYEVRAKVCVGVSGMVDSVVVMKRAHPMLDSNVASEVKTWRFRPLMANGTAVPFCYFANFDFSSG